jgi:DNA-binding transcriptional regulator YiaG
MLTMAKRRSTPLTPARIKEIRERLGLTQAQAAERIGVARRTWMYWESPARGQRPSPAAVSLIHLLAEGKL